MTGRAVRISVVVVARNAERFISDALRSIERSTRKPDEIVVVDGDSSDGTRQVAERFDGVRVIAQRSRGIASAYNEGIAATSGELVAFLSADDRWLPEKLARQERALAQKPDAGLALCLVQHELEPGVAPPPGFRRELLAAPVPGYIMECLLVRRAVFATVGLFDPSMPVSEDTDWFARARDAKVGMHVVPELLVRKRVHDTNASLNDPQINQHLLLALRRTIARKRRDGAAEA